jgi:phage shock protein A
MHSDTYRETLERAKQDLLSARQEREQTIKKQDELEKRIIELRRTVAALAALCGEAFDEDDEFGLTDSIRMALKTHGGALNAKQVEARLLQLGYKTKSPNLLASVHTVLKRLVLKGEVDDSAVMDNKQAYQWIKKD